MPCSIVHPWALIFAVTRIALLPVAYAAFRISEARKDSMPQLVLRRSSSALWCARKHAANSRSNASLIAARGRKAGRHVKESCSAVSPPAAVDVLTDPFAVLEEASSCATGARRLGTSSVADAELQHDASACYDRSAYCTLLCL